MKFQVLTIFVFVFLFFFVLITRERVGIKTHRTESRAVIGPGKHTACRRVRALFSPEIVQAWAVRGLIILKKEDYLWCPISIVRAQSAYRDMPAEAV